MLATLRLRPIAGVRRGRLVPQLCLPFILGILLLGYALWWDFDPGLAGYQHEWLFLDTVLARDGLSRLFVERTRVRLPRCRLSRSPTSYQAPSLRSLEFMRLGVFMVTDLRPLYVLFEVMLRPMYRLVGIWGSRSRKVRASYRLVLYTLAGSISLLVGLLTLDAEIGGSNRLALSQLGTQPLASRWLAMFRAFAVKVPMVPFHGWLPEAHVEATTTGSVLLAGLLLKIGTYGLIRVLVQRMPVDTEYWSPLVFTMACLGLVYTARAARRQLDLKRIIAYSSISHMNLMILGRFRQDGLGIQGAVLQMLSHGLVSAGLFRLVGVRYERYHTRLVGYYGGLAITMPLYARMLRSFALANRGRPGTSAFVGEWLIRVGLSEASPRLLVVASASLMRTGTYTLWTYNRLVYGNRKRAYRSVDGADRYCLEVLFLRPRWLSMWCLGFHPSLVRDRLRLL